jgi:hypothetical protein
MWTATEKSWEARLHQQVEKSSEMSTASAAEFAQAIVTLEIKNASLLHDVELSWQHELTKAEVKALLNEIALSVHHAEALTRYEIENMARTVTVMAAEKAASDLRETQHVIHAEDMLRRISSLESELDKAKLLAAKSEAAGAAEVASLKAAWTSAATDHVDIVATLEEQVKC